MKAQTHTAKEAFPPKEHLVSRRSYRSLLGALAVATSLVASPHLLAGTAIDTSKDVSKNPPVASEKGPPLPLHEIEGNGGVLTTLSAYIVNPPRNGEPVGRPAIGSGFISLGNGWALVPATVTWSPWDRIELGYGFNWLSLGNLPTDIRNATGISIGNTSVAVHNFNARFQLLKENEFNQKWLPALTFGVHYKYNVGISEINDDLGGALDQAGLSGNNGVDFTLYASKLITFLPRPVLINVGGRATGRRSSDSWASPTSTASCFEGNVAIFLTDWLILAGEYRQQPNSYTPIPGLIGNPETGGRWTWPGW